MYGDQLEQGSKQGPRPQRQQWEGQRAALDMHCRGWQQEGIYRLLQNVLAPDVAENPYELVVYGNGKAVRNHAALTHLLYTLTNLADDETLLVQSGKPVGVLRTHPLAPRVIMANSMLVPHWSTWARFHELERKNLTMYGQSTASSWAYIGAQGILQNTYETLWHIAQSHFDGSLRGRLVLTSGLGGMGCAQPMAVEMNEGVAIIVEIDAEKVSKRVETNHVQMATYDLDEALALAREALAKKQPRTIALIANAVDIYEEMLRRGIIPDVVTDQTSAHDLLQGYIPQGFHLGLARKLRVENANEYLHQARDSVRRHVDAILGFQAQGAVAFEYGNHLRGQALEAGLENAMEYPSFITLFARDLFCQGTGPLRWIALSGNPEDIYAIDEWLMQEFQSDSRLVSWLRFAANHVHFQGLPARSAWLTYEQRMRFATRLGEMVRTGEVFAPVAVTRDHFDGATMASPHRETEGMPDGSDAIADWPILNALLMAASGATLVSVQQGGGVGVGYSVHTGMTVIVDGSENRARAVERVIMGEPELGMLRYADSGYESARAQVKRYGFNIDTENGNLQV